VQIDEVKYMSRKPASAKFAVLLDARPVADFKGEKGEHIWGAVNQYQKIGVIQISQWCALL